MQKRFLKIIFIVIPVVVIVAIITVILIMNSRGASSYKEALDNYMSAFDQGDLKGMKQAMFPKKVEKEIYDNQGENSFLMDTRDDWKDPDISYEIVRRTSVDDEIDEFEKHILEKYNAKVNVSEMYIIEIKTDYSYNDSDKEDRSRDESYRAYKMNGKWFVLPEYF